MKIPYSLLEILICLSVVAVFAAVVGLMVRGQRRRAQKKAELAAQLGFNPLPQPDSALVERIYGLFALKNRRLHLRSVFHRRAPDYDLYLFDLVDTSGESSSILADNGVAVVSRYLRLPRLSLMTRIEGTGFLANTANSVIARLLTSLGAPAIAFPDEPEFDAHFLVTGLDEVGTHSFLSRGRAERMLRMGLQNAQIQMSGDIFTLSSAVTGGTQRGDPLEVVGQAVRDAESLASCFME